MRYLLTICLLSLLSPLSLASKYIDSLASADVSHLELAVSNLNLFLMREAQIHLKENPIKQGEISRSLSFLQVTNDEKLLVTSAYTSPVKTVTKKVCEEKLDEERKIFETDGMAGFLDILSVKDFPVSEARVFLGEAKFDFSPT